MLDVRRAGKTAVYDAKIANRDYTSVEKKAPYKKRTSVVEFTTESSEQFVRVFGEGGNAAGGWLMKKGDIQGLTPAQIQDKFALPKMPTQVVDVTVPKGTRIRTGTTAPVKGWGNGGGQQYELIDQIPKSSFSKPQKLPEKPNG